jgi:hypothetical protein
VERIWYGKTNPAAPRMIIDKRSMTGIPNCPKSQVTGDETKKGNKTKRIRVNLPSKKA